MYLRILSFIFLTIAGLQNLHSQGFKKFWHTQSGHYNYYYNAFVLIETAALDGESGYTYNFKDIIELFPLKPASELKSNSGKMDEALKKCSYVIEKKSTGKYVDDSYLLMGDANFYKGEFYSAIEIYEHVAGTYKEFNTSLQAELNLIKTYLQMQKFDDAEALYTKLKNDKKRVYTKKQKSELNLLGASINIKQGKKAAAIKLLQEAIPGIKGKMNKTRAWFVLGQLLAFEKKYDESTIAFKKVLKLNPPYEFVFNAKINMAKNINPKNKNEVRKAYSELSSLLRDDKNIDYFDLIYYEMGSLNLILNNESSALVDFKKSLASKTSDGIVKTNSYIAVADIYFKKQDYESAQKYYDSAARGADEKHPQFKFIQQKNLILNDLIKHLVNIKEKDSLIKLGKDEKYREKMIDNAIINEEKLKEEEKLKQEQDKNLQNLANSNPMNNNIPVNTSNFPFYNQASKTKGYQDFQRIWGGRTHQEYWAIKSNKTAIYKQVNDDQSKAEFGNEKKSELILKANEQRKKYYYNIPFTKDDQEKFKVQIAESHFLAANIYYQSLKENDKAKKLLETQINKYTPTSFDENAYFLLAKIYKEENNMPQYQKYYDFLKQKYAHSNFLKLLDLNKDSASKNNSEKNIVDSEIETLYVQFYNQFKAKKYTEALKTKEQNDKKFLGNPYQVNYDYIESLIYSELGQKDLFEKKLRAVAETYSQTEIGKKAQKTVDFMDARKNAQNNSDSLNLKPKATESKFSTDKNSKHFFALVIPVGKTADEFKKWFIEYHNTNYPSDNLQVTNSLLNKETQFILISNYKEYTECIKYIDQLNETKKIMNEMVLSEMPQMFIINQQNLSLILKEKNLTEYLEFYQKNYKIK